MVLDHCTNAAVLSLLCLSFATVSADDQELLETLKSSPQQERIDDCIRRLDSDRFSERTGANRELQAIGSTAYPALTEAALGRSREVTLRAFEILKRGFKAGTKEEKQAAERALKKLAATEHPIAAPRAKSLVDPPPPMPVVPGGIGVAGVAGAVIVPNGAPGLSRVRSMQFNRQGRIVTLEENGRPIQYTLKNNGQIEIERKETNNGRQIKEKIAVKDTAELKRKHPDLFRLYERHNLSLPVVVIEK